MHTFSIDPIPNKWWIRTMQEERKVNKIKKTICVLLSLMMIALPVAAGGFSAAAVSEESSGALVTVGYNPLSKDVGQALLDQETELPDRVDLRNFNGKNYVTPVKKQDPFGSCWAFGIAGAAEISFLHDNGLGVPAGEVNDLIDISEKYINWYMFHAITADDVELGCVPASQVGEGVDPSKMEETNMNAVYELGGNGAFASNFFASGFGPVDEDEEVDGSYPYLYQGKNGWKSSDDMTGEERSACISYFALKQKNDLLPMLLEMGTISSEDEYDAWFEANWDDGDRNKDFCLIDKSGYAPFDDWTLPLNSKYHNAGLVSYFKRSYVLPAPADSDEDGEYKFNPLGVTAMKSELSNGHGIAISILADQSEPGQESGDDGYMKVLHANEAIKNARWMSGDITDKAGKAFAVEVLNHMRSRLSDYQEAYGDLYNLEATPAESTTYRFAKHDVEEFGDIITAAKPGEAPYYTNSSHLPVGYTDDIFDALDMEDELQTLYTSGTVFHGFLGQRLPDWKSAANLVRKIAYNFKLPYYTMSPTYSVCREHGYIQGEHFKCPICGKDAEVYSRITGYYRPVRNWNDGKASEFRNRKTYAPGDPEFTDGVRLPNGNDIAQAATDNMLIGDKLQEQENAAPAKEAAAMDQAQAKAVLLTTRTCPNCNTAKTLLNEAGIEYDVVYAEEPEGAALASEYNITSAPTLIVQNGEKADLYGNVSNIRGFIHNIQ